MIAIDFDCVTLDNAGAVQRALHLGYQEIVLSTLGGRIVMMLPFGRDGLMLFADRAGGCGPGLRSLLHLLILLLSGSGPSDHAHRRQETSRDQKPEPVASVTASITGHD
jgi:hypothetical protein